MKVAEALHKTPTPFFIKMQAKDTGASKKDK